MGVLQILGLDYEFLRLPQLSRSGSLKVRRLSRIATGSFCIRSISLKYADALHFSEYLKLFYLFSAQGRIAGIHQDRLPRGGFRIGCQINGRIRYIFAVYCPSKTGGLLQFF